MDNILLFLISFGVVYVAVSLVQMWRERQIRKRDEHDADFVHKAMLRGIANRKAKREAEADDRYYADKARRKSVLKPLTTNVDTITPHVQGPGQSMTSTHCFKDENGYWHDGVGP